LNFIIEFSFLGGALQNPQICLEKEAKIELVQTHIQAIVFSGEEIGVYLLVGLRGRAAERGCPEKISRDDSQSKNSASQSCWQKEVFPTPRTPVSQTTAGCS